MQRRSFSPRPVAGAKTIGAFVALLVVAGVSTACRQATANDKPAAPQVVAQATTVPDVFGSIGDQKITMADVHDLAGDDLDKLETQYQLAKSRIIGVALDSIVHQRTIAVEAKKEGKTEEQLIAAAAPGGTIEPTGVAIETWYKENSDRLGGRTLDQLRSQIADLLRKQNHDDAEKALVKQMKTAWKVAITYQPYRLQFANGDAPVRGKKDAPITLVEFSDFQCPFCQRMAPVLKQISEQYGDKVRLVYRQDPIPSLHPFALKAAEASLCAQEQGKFWEMHDAMFQNQTKLAVSDLKETAQHLGMDGKKFNSCIDSGRYAEQVQNDAKEAVRAGVAGTPAVFVNGIVIPGGSVPLGTVQAAIDRELARSSATP